jgi:SAM-dependent methyltransferase
MAQQQTADHGLRPALAALAAWLALAVPLGAVAGVYVGLQRQWAINRYLQINHYFLIDQDAVVLVLASLALGLVCLPVLTVSEAAAERAGAIAVRHGAKIAWAAGALVFLAALIGARVVYQHYPLSLDEFWATFDARIFAHGRVLAEIPAQWRPFAAALQPQWRMEIAGDSHWASTYLPMNAALRAAFGLLGSQDLAGAFWSGLSVVAVFFIGRRLWPARPDAALVGALLLATSAQLLFAGMSAYAMPAHLALNLVWLWLVLRRTRASHAAAAAAAFVATGLHQMIFHPLFAAPFVLDFWRARRWGAAVFHTVAYLVICLFWMVYWTVMLKSQGLAMVSQTGLGAVHVVYEAIHLVRHIKPNTVGMMAENGLRFIAWQNPLAVGLGVVGGVLAVRAREPVGVCLAAGVVLTTAAMMLLLAFQGEGWGYRYLHGFLGSLCLLAGSAWARLTPQTWPPRRAWATLTALTVFSLVVAMPIRAVQAFALIHPFAQAHAAIERAPADVVIVDPSGVWYGRDEVRNDPFLSQGPKVLSADMLTPAQAEALCARYRVAVFDRQDAPFAGVRTFDQPEDVHIGQVRAAMAARSCGRHVLAGPSAGGREVRDMSLSERYALRLKSTQTALWKRLLNAQAPYRWNLRRLGPGRTLDIGCGVGRNLGHLGGTGVGVDPNPACVAEATAAGFEAYLPGDLPAGAFDTLLFSHVLEHLEQPQGLVADYLPRLAPRGQVILITPQEAGFASDETHLRFLDLDALGAMVQTLGLRVERAFSFPFPRWAGRLFRYNEFVLTARRTAASGA